MGRISPRRFFGGTNIADIRKYQNQNISHVVMPLSIENLLICLAKIVCPRASAAGTGGQRSSPTCSSCQFAGVGPIALPNAFNWGNDTCEIDLTFNPHAPFQGVTWPYQRSRTAVHGMAWRVTLISRPAGHCMVLALQDEIGFSIKPNTITKPTRDHNPPKFDA